MQSVAAVLLIPLKHSLRSVVSACTTAFRILCLVRRVFEHHLLHCWSTRHAHTEQEKKDDRNKQLQNGQRKIGTKVKENNENKIETENFTPTTTHQIVMLRISIKIALKGNSSINDSWQKRILSSGGLFSVESMPGRAAATLRNNCLTL